MRNKKDILLRAFAIVLGFTFHSQMIAQDEGVSDTLNFGEVISIGNRNLTLKDAFKLSSTPSIRDTVIEISTLDFMVTPIKASTSFEVKPLKPANLKIIDQLPKYYRSYVLGGFGLYASPKAELYFNSLRNRNWNYGFDAKHFSSNGGIKDVPSSAYGNTNATFWATHFLKKSAITFSGAYKNNRVHYYGGTEKLDSIFTKEQIEQKVNSADFKMSARSFFKDTSKINYIINARYKYLKDHFETKEHRARVDGHILGMYLNQYYDLEYIVDYNSTASVLSNLGDNNLDTLTSSTQQNTLVGINPAIELHGDKWKIMAGVNMYFDNTSFHFYPRAEAYYELFDKLFIPYIGLNGGMKKKTFGEFFKENPFVISSVSILNTNQKFFIYGGLRGKLASKVSFDFKIGHEEIDNMPLFVNDTNYSAQNRFTIRYDKVKINSVYGALKYSNLDKLSIGLSAKYNHYQSTNELYAWHKPNLKIDLSADYNLSNKFLVGLNIYYIGSRKAASYLAIDGITPDQGVYVVELDSYVDANLKFEYRYTQRLSGFININNLFSAQYDTWYLYKVQPFFAMLGATYSF